MAFCKAISVTAYSHRGQPRANMAKPQVLSVILSIGIPLFPHGSAHQKVCGLSTSVFFKKPGGFKQPVFFRKSEDLKKAL